MHPRTFVFLCSVWLIATPASAQRDRLLVEPPPPVNWGLVASFTPRWDTPSPLQDLLGNPIDEDFSGSEFTIGFVRGLALGGDWGVSFVRKGVKDGSFLDREGFSLIDGRQQVVLDRLFPRGLSVAGAEVNLYVPFRTIRERVQIALNVAGGIGKLRGRVEQHRFQIDSTGSPLPQTEHVSERALDHVIFDNIDLFPLGKVELALAVIATPNVKVRVGGGFNYPGTQVFSLTFLYFLPRGAL